MKPENRVIVDSIIKRLEIKPDTGYYTDFVKIKREIGILRLDYSDYLECVEYAGHYTGAINE